MDIYTRNNKKQIIKRLNNEEICIIPTDTIYGISSIITNPELRKKINKIKKSYEYKDLIILVSSIKEASKLANISKKEILLLKNNQPTTVICTINKEYSNKDITNNNKVAIRLVKNKFLKKIIKNTGPLYSTSANFSKDKYIGDINIFKKFSVNFIVFDDLNNKMPSMIYDSELDRYIR